MPPRLSHHNHASSANNQRRATLVVIAIVMLFILHAAVGFPFSSHPPSLPPQHQPTEAVKGGTAPKRKRTIDDDGGDDQRLPNDEGRQNIKAEGSGGVASNAPTPPNVTIHPLLWRSANVTSLPCIPAPFLQKLYLAEEALSPAKPYRPRHIQKELDEIAQFGLERYIAIAPKGANSQTVTEDDLKRAEINWIEPLPQAGTRRARCLDPSDSSKGAFVGTKKHQRFHNQNQQDLEAFSLSITLYNSLRHVIQKHVIDGAPMVVDIGCVVGEEFARRHSLATVVCLHTGRKFDTKPSFVDVPSNLFHLFSPSEKSFVEGEFKQFFEMCNFFTLVFAFGNLRKDLQFSSRVHLLDLLSKVLPSSALLYTAIPESDSNAFNSLAFVSPPATTQSPEEADEERLRGMDSLVKKNQQEQRRARDKSAAEAAAADQQSNARIDLLNHKDVALALVANDAAGEAPKRILIRQYVLGRSSRPCRKTWNAPFVQWSRSQSVTFDEGRVSFLVKNVPKPGDPPKDDKLRFIHPLQYLHSLNLDTLLGAGLSDSVRMRLLAEMIATPRYSDPLPHNWVVTEGGRVQRIDKIDLAYDSKVDERKGYWGRSTRGYLHLLTEHMCLPVNPDGSPSTFLRLEGECVETCRNCIDLCSYLPKGTICGDCFKCGEECLRPLALELQASVLGNDLVSFTRVKTCQRTYSSMHSARKVWAKWEKDDNMALARAGV